MEMPTQCRSRKMSRSGRSALVTNQVLAAALLLGPALVACSSVESDQAAINRSSDYYPQAAEVEVIYLPLAEPLSLPISEMSAMTWCGETLLVLPQYPDFLNDAPAALYGFQKSQIKKAITSSSVEPLAPEVIPVENLELMETIAGYEGIEAAVCDGNELILAIETNQLGAREATVFVQADYRDHSVRINAIGATVASPTELGNKGNEALVKTSQGLLSLHEVNDARWLNGNDSAQLLTSFDSPEKSIPVSDFSYRLTDATQLDSDHRFWVINYQYQGDKPLVIGSDPLWKQHGIGASHKTRLQVERLVELEFTGDSVVLTDTPPIQLALEGTNGRNWEGIARLDDLGFLLVTDKHPDSLLGFVPSPKGHSN